MGECKFISFHTKVNSHKQVQKLNKKIKKKLKIIERLNQNFSKNIYRMSNKNRNKNGKNEGKKRKSNKKMKKKRKTMYFFLIKTTRTKLKHNQVQRCTSYGGLNDLVRINPLCHVTLEERTRGNPHTKLS